MNNVDVKYWLNILKNDFEYEEKISKAPEEIRDNSTIMFEFCKNSSYCFQFLSERLRDDKNFVLSLLKNGHKIDFTSLSLRLKNDFDIITASLQINTYIFCDLSESYKDNDFIVSYVLSREPRLIEYISNRLKNDKKLILDCKYIDLEYVSENLKDDYDIVLKSVESSGYNLKFASSRLKDNKEVVLRALKNASEAYMFISPKLREDKEIASFVFENNGFMLQYASDDIKNNKELVYKAICHNGCSLQYASRELRNDEDLVLTAVGCDAKALRFASEELMRSREFALKVIKQHPNAISYLRYRFATDPEIIKINKNMWKI